MMSFPMTWLYPILCSLIIRTISGRSNSRSTNASALGSLASLSVKVLATGGSEKWGLGVGVRVGMGVVWVMGGGDTGSVDTSALRRVYSKRGSRSDINFLTRGM